MLLPCKLVAAAALLLAPQAQAQELTPQGRERMASYMVAATGSRGHLGAVTLVARHGKVLDWQAYGFRDLQRQVPMTTDAIFRIYSMSKSVAAVATLVLMEQGRLTLDDPVSRHLREFEQLQVFAGGSAKAPRLRAPQRPLTIRHLLTHTAGFATGGHDIEQASLLLERADLPASANLQDFAQRVARVPLAADPGERFRYDGVQFEVLGRLIEVVSGLPLDAFVQQHIFGPLKMVDTGFKVPLPERRRIVDVSTTSAAGRLVLDSGPSAVQPGVMLRPYFSLAGGLYSTAPDFMRFCQMLLGGGTLAGATVLARSSVDLMLSNQLLQRNPPPGVLPTEARAGEGMGLGGWVILDSPQRRRPGSVGSFGWSGAASTYFMIDPKLQIMAILLLQHLPPEEGQDLPKRSSQFYDRVYEALNP
jgi:CubicO group peptidase (beta-lactamase class C family)